MKKKVLISIAAVLTLLLVLGVLQALVVPKYVTNEEGRLTGEYYADSKDHDVIFVGDCEIYESVVPSVLWNEYGITSYVRGNAQQLAWHSYYLLEETFKYEKPKAVVFNVYALKYGTPQSEAYNRMVFDAMRWSPSKVKGILASQTNGENLLDYVFPLLRYHSRITDLESEDFKYLFSTPDSYSDNGYLIKTGVLPMKESKPITESPEELLPQSSLDYVKKMKELCDKNGSELILIKAPTNSRGYWWYDEWEEQIAEFANQQGLKYYNFIPNAEEMGIDWQTDTYDEGLHLNANGAEKFTKYLGEVLAENHNLKSEKSEDVRSKWNGYYQRYEKIKKDMEALNK